MISRPQAEQLGLTRAVIRRLISAGQWVVVDPGVYAENGSQRSWLGLAWAALLIAGPDARLAGTSAATLHTLSDEQTLPIEVLIPARQKVRDRDWAKFCREGAERRGRSIGRPPRTRIDDTVLDLCCRGDEAEVITWMTRAVQRRLTTPASIQRTLLTRPRCTNRGLIMDLAHDTSQGVHSHLERRYLYAVERAHGLPVAQRQFSVPESASVADAAYVEQRLLIELDGRRWHQERAPRDRRRDNRHARPGWLTYRFGWEDVTTDCCRTAAELAATLTERGWKGLMRPCPRCVELPGW